VTSTDIEQQRQELHARLDAIDREEREKAEQQRREEQAASDAALPPEKREQKETIENLGRAALDREYPDAWQPQKNSEHPQELTGLVLRIDPRVGPSKAWGTYSAIIEMQTTDGREWSLWANEGGVMHNQLTRLRIQPGEVIAVRYRGKVESKANPGQHYQDFRLVRVEDDGPAAPIDYDALERSRATPALPAPEQPPVDDDIPF
jgi:hypothetical protein